MRVQLQTLACKKWNDDVGKRGPHTSYVTKEAAAAAQRETVLTLCLIAKGSGRGGFDTHHGQKAGGFGEA
jgi:hypothetical protein